MTVNHNALEAIIPLLANFLFTSPWRDMLFFATPTQGSAYVFEFAKTSGQNRKRANNKAAMTPL